MENLPMLFISIVNPLGSRRGFCLWFEVNAEVNIEDEWSRDALHMVGQMLRLSSWNGGIASS